MPTSTERLPARRRTKRTRSATRTASRHRSPTTNALRVIDRLVEGDHELAGLIAEETLNAHVGRLIYEARTQAGLTQQQLADLVGTKQPVIARLEDADYTGHSLTMLHRIATALGLRVDLRFIPPQASSGT